MNEFFENNLSMESLSGLLSYTFLDNSLWQLLLALLVIVVFVYGSNFFTRLFNTLFVKRYFKEESFFRLLFSAITRPVTVIVIWVGIRFAIGILTLADSILAFVSSAYTILLTVLFAWLLSNVYLVFHEKFVVGFLNKSDTEIDSRLSPIIGSTIKALIWIFAIILGVSNAGYDIKAILAGLGIGGLAIALAGQDLIANVFGGLLIFLQRPFAMGSYVEVGGVRGWVENIGFRSIQIRDFYGHSHHIPNKACADGVVNIDDRPCYYVNGKLHLHFSTSREKIQLILERLREAPKVDETLFSPGNWLTLESIGQYYFCVDFWFVIKKFSDNDKPEFPGEYDKISAGTTKIHLEIIRILEENHVRLALPMQVMEVNNDQPESLFSGKAM